jgi:hypothetical protein
MEGKKKFHQRGASAWQKIIREHRCSGLSISTYCRKTGLSVSSFYAWRQRLSQSETSELKDFIKITPPAKDVRSPLRTRTPEGYLIEVSEGTDTIFLSNVIAALGER